MYMYTYKINEYIYIYIYIYWVRFVWFQIPSGKPTDPPPAGNH